VNSVFKRKKVARRKNRILGKKRSEIHPSALLACLSVALFLADRFVIYLICTMTPTSPDRLLWHGGGGGGGGSQVPRKRRGPSRITKKATTSLQSD
jgi:hypothetical protein